MFPKFIQKSDLIQEIKTFSKDFQAVHIQPILDRLSRLERDKVDISFVDDPRSPFREVKDRLTKMEARLGDWSSLSSSENTRHCLVELAVRLSKLEQVINDHADQIEVAKDFVGQRLSKLENRLASIERGFEMLTDDLFTLEVLKPLDQPQVMGSVQEFFDHARETARKLDKQPPASPDAEIPAPEPLHICDSKTEIISHRVGKGQYKDAGHVSTAHPFQDNGEGKCSVCFDATKVLVANDNARFHFAEPQTFLRYKDRFLKIASLGFLFELDPNQTYRFELRGNDILVNVNSTTTPRTITPEQLAGMLEELIDHLTDGGEQGVTVTADISSLANRINAFFAGDSK